MTITASFYDVDGTLINTKSLISFFYDYLDTLKDEKRHRIKASFQMLLNEYRSGTNRESVNRRYYSLLQGEDIQNLNRIAHSWYQRISKNNLFYVNKIFQRIMKEKNSGKHIVLVSGSFYPILDLIAKDVGADAVLCSQPEIKSGILTGNLLDSACIGQGKVEKILTYIQKKSISLSGSSAYGDDASDIPMLMLAANGYLIKPTRHYSENLII